MENKSEKSLRFNFILLLLILIFVKCKVKSKNPKTIIQTKDSVYININPEYNIKQEVINILEDVLILINKEELQDFPYNILILNEFKKSRMHINSKIFENISEFEKFKFSQEDTLNYKFRVDNFLSKKYNMFDTKEYSEFLNKKEDNSIIVSLSYPYIYKKYASIEVEVLISRDNGFKLFYLLEKDKTWNKIHKDYMIIY